MDRDNWTYKCNKCGSIMEYSQDTYMEEFKWLRFKCIKCNHEIFTHDNNIYINKIRETDKQKLMIIRGNKVLIDKDCVDLVEYFNDIGLDTKYSCSGHGEDTFEIVFEDYIADEQIEAFISKYRNKYNHSLFLGKFSKWCRVMNGELKYNWIYTAKDVRDAKITYMRIISKDRGEY